MTAAPTFAPAGSAGPRLRTWLPWALLFVVVLTLLAFGAQGSRGDLTAQDRVTDLARSIKCPQCTGESAAESNSPSSQELRRDIAQRIEQGQTDDEIRAAYVDRYGERILLTPPSTGVASLVWIVPVVAVVVAIAALVLVMRSGSRGRAGGATDADRTLVEAARADADRAATDDVVDSHGEGSSR